MAGFKTHITTSSVLGVAYGAGALAWGGDAVQLPTAVLAGGLCGISGMLPDLDSGPGIPLRESVAFAAAVVPMHLVDRFQHMQWSNESIVLFGALVYLLIRFGLGALLKRFTVHRGMFHSIPAAMIATELAFLLASGDVTMRCYKAGGVLIGFMSHLILDEIYSVQWHRGRMRFKSSFGTAVKLWGRSLGPNLICYACLGVLTLAALNDHAMGPHEHSGQEVHHVASSLLDRLLK